MRKNGEVSKTTFTSLRKNLLSEIRDFTGETVVVSCENFWKMDKFQIKLLRSVFEEYETRILVYLRRQDKFLESRSTNLTLIGDLDSYKSKVMNPVSGYRRACDYSGILGHWADVFGRENVIVRVFEPDNFFNGNIVDDVLHVLGVVRPNGFLEPELQNISLVRDGLEIKSVLNGLLKDPALPNPLSPSHDFISSIHAFTQYRNLQRYSLFTQNEREALFKWYQPTNFDVARLYLKQFDGDLFSAPTERGGGVPANEYPGLSTELFAEYVTWLESEHPELYSRLMAAIQRGGRERSMLDNHAAGLRRRFLRLLGFKVGDTKIGE